MDKKAYLQTSVDRGERMALEHQQTVIDALEELLKRAKDGDMLSILYNIHTVTSPAARALQSKHEAVGTKTGLLLFEHDDQA